MLVSANPIVIEIKAYIMKCGGGWGQWYVGIAADARDRLFSDHRVREDGDAWIRRTADTHQEARQIEDYFVNTLSTRGGTGGGNATTRSVYAYRIAAHTKQ